MNDLLTVRAGSSNTYRWDPVTRHELILEGSLGRLLGVSLHTDGLRYPTLQVLQPGEVSCAPVLSN